MPPPPTSAWLQRKPSAAVIDDEGPFLPSETAGDDASATDGATFAAAASAEAVRCNLGRSRPCLQGGQGRGTRPLRRFWIIELSASSFRPTNRCRLRAAYFGKIRNAQMLGDDITHGRSKEVMIFSTKGRPFFVGKHNQWKLFFQLKFYHINLLLIWYTAYWILNLFSKLQNGFAQVITERNCYGKPWQYPCCLDSD